MRTLFAIVCAALIAVAAPALACHGPECYGSGNFNINTNAGDYGDMYDRAWMPNGGAYSDAEGYGSGHGHAHGDVRKDGTAEAHLTSTGGGLAAAEAGRFVPKDEFGNPLGDRRIGVETKGFGQTTIGGSIDLSATAEAGPHRYGPQGHGEARGDYSAYGDFSSFSKSWTWESPRFFENTWGLSWSTADVGGWAWLEGDAHVHADGYWDREWVGYNYYNHRTGESVTSWRRPSGSGWCNHGRVYDYVAKGEAPNAGSEAGITLYGNTYSASYRFVAEDNGAYTEGMGSLNRFDFGASSFGRDYDFGPGHDHADAYGRFNVGGSIASNTSQYSATGYAIAGMNASVYGSGSLGCDIVGGGNGYTYTTMTSFEGMSGGINTAGAGASINVSATRNGGIDAPQ